ncbi:hypothetical protein CYMTET_19724 [Cymbomonas tetramitiformis]|uniref:Coiled-coil domain-containing protein 12 n=1 Tax=Cymbomonas tetramitiformis TaxID=36881 RepID=A0AAE0L4W7_9CHLO|nr:hypothetical protein CYMTET_19724 [Cymbomonas tetramitiformis]
MSLCHFDQGGVDVETASMVSFQITYFSLPLLQIEAAKPEEFEEPNIEPSAGLDDAIDGEEAIMSVAPKKANWDLRRDVAKKLEKLERRTQRAMVELMQEEEKRRMEAGENEEDAEMGA